MTPLRQRMHDALVLHGKAARTQDAYIEAVARLARYYRRSPDRLNNEQVQQYLCTCCKRVACRAPLSTRPAVRFASSTAPLALLEACPRRRATGRDPRRVHGDAGYPGRGARSFERRRPAGAAQLQR